MVTVMLTTLVFPAVTIFGGTWTAIWVAEGAPFITRHIIQAAASSFDDFAGSAAGQAANRRMLGLE